MSKKKSVPMEGSCFAAHIDWLIKKNEEARAEIREALKRIEEMRKE